MSDSKGSFGSSSAMIGGSMGTSGLSARGGDSQGWRSSSSNDRSVAFFLFLTHCNSKMLIDIHISCHVLYCYVPIWTHSLSSFTCFLDDLSVI